MKSRLLVVLLLGACSLDSKGPGGADAPGDAYYGPVGTVTGVVWAPGNGPATVGASEAIPVYDAVISITREKLEPIPDQTYCEACQQVGGFSTRSAHDGTFELVASPGAHWLTIQKAQFRREFQVKVTIDKTLELVEEQTTLPSEHDPGQGKWMPRVALASAGFDQLQTVFIKMGIGTGGFSSYKPTDRVHWYQHQPRQDQYTGDFAALVQDLTKMRQYHIIIIPCSNAHILNVLRTQQVMQNLRDYVAEGGALFVTDWSGEWADNVFPAQLDLGAGGRDTPADAYNAQAGTWDMSKMGDADGPFYHALGANAKDPNLSAWLSVQSGPRPGNTDGPYDGSNFDVLDNYNVIWNLSEVSKGKNEDGIELMDKPHVWVEGPEPFNGAMKPMTVTYEPAGCGRVMYSVSHTTETEHDGLYPQERVLLYMILEVAVCSQEPAVIE